MRRPSRRRLLQSLQILIIWALVPAGIEAAESPIASSWKLVAYDDDARYYLNLDRIERSDSTVRLWGKTEHVDGQPFSAEYKLFCPEFEYQQLRSLALMEDDHLQRDYEAGERRSMEGNPFMIRCFELFCGERRTEFHPNGNMRQRGWVYLPRDGDQPVKTGLWTYWHDNGAKREELSFRAGVKNGPWSFWTRDGKLWKEQQVVNGIPEGVTQTWYPDGRKSSEMTYRNGKLDGKVTSWNQEGEVIEEIWYRNGIPASEE